jgi:TonB family protein
MPGAQQFRLLVLVPILVSIGGRLCGQEFSSAPQALLPIIDGKMAGGLLLVQTPPNYPAIAKVNYLQGTVELQVAVDAQGKVARAHVLNGDAVLAVSALQAARGWIYTPLATAAGPSGFTTTVALRFALDLRGIALTPQQAEKDFWRRTKPAEAITPPRNASPEEMVHLRLLINDRGQIVDRQVTWVDRAQFDEACEALRNWRFRPAYWGALPVASYVDVNVPVEKFGTPSEANLSER